MSDSHNEPLQLELTGSGFDTYLILSNPLLQFDFLSRLLNQRVRGVGSRSESVNLLENFFASEITGSTSALST